MNRQTERNPFDLIFFDVDGTLIDMKTRTITQKTLDALRALQRRGIKIVLCTGRTPSALPDLDIRFDGIAACNGSVCLAGDHVIHSHPIEKADAKRIVSQAQAIGKPVTIATVSGIHTSGWERNLSDYFEIGRLSLQVSPDFRRHLEQEEIYQIMCGIEPHQYDTVMKGVKHAKIAAWWNRAADIIPDAGGKGEGVRALCESFGIDPSRCAAFGDGGNDLEMLEAAGHGIAMGNACKELKEAADEVCLAVDRDGVWEWCLRHGLLEEE